MTDYKGFLMKLREDGYADHHIFKSKTFFDLVLVNTTPIHVGAGREAAQLSSLSDLTVVRGSVAIPLEKGVIVYRGPIIPGSSLKGVLRTLAESYSLARGLMVESLEECLGSEWKARCTGEELSEVESTLRKLENLSEVIEKCYSKCLASPPVRIFGAPWLKSHITVYDAYPETLENPPMRAVTRVSIDRVTMSQSPGKLYTMEHVEAGTRWRARIALDNIDPRSDAEIGETFLYIFKKLEEGIHVGGRKTIGMGLLKLMTNESRVIVEYLRNGEPVREEKSLAEYLDEIRR